MIRFSPLQRLLTSRLSRSFAVKVIDPYKLLEVKKSDEFTAIKKKYYQLVSQYHPDKNDSETANEIFKDILEAYEMIKQDRGLSTKKPLIKAAAPEDDGFKSKRPYASEYSENFDREKNKYGNFDSAEFYYRTGSETKYSQYTDSFREMYEATRTDFKPAEGEIPDTLARFKMDEVKTKNKKYADSDSFSVGLVLIVLLGAALINQGINLKGRKEEEEEKLSKESRAVNRAVTTLDKSDVVESNKMINQTYTLQTSVGDSVALQPQMSRAEKLLKKKTPHIEVFDPDAQE